MNKFFMLSITLILTFLITPLIYGSGYHAFNGEYHDNLATLKVEHSIVYNIRKNEKTGKVEKKRFQRTTFSIVDNKKENLLYLGITVNGKTYIWKNHFEAKGANNLTQTFTMDGFPSSVTFNISYSMGQISRPFNKKYDLNMKLDYSTIHGSHGEGKIIIEKAK